MLSGYIRVERHGDDIIGGVARGGQSATPLAGLVDRRHIAHPLGNVPSLGRLQPHLTEGDQIVLKVRADAPHRVRVKSNLDLICYLNINFC